MLEVVNVDQKVSKGVYAQFFPQLEYRLAELQREARAAGIPIIVVFEGWDASGKGTCINSLMQPLDPRGFKVWSIKESLPLFSGTLATAGDVVFYGTLDGWFKDADARTGAVLWPFKVGSGVVGNPVTYLGPDGK